MQEAHLTPGIMFSLLFLMIGPIKILVPFVNMTRDGDPRFRFRLATRAVLFSIAGLVIAGVVGRRFIYNFGIPFPVLSLTGGLVLLLVALRAVLDQFSGPPAPRTNPVAPELGLAITPLAFPTIITPYGTAIFIILVGVAADDLKMNAVVVGMAAAVLAIDWLAMLFAHTILRWMGTILQIFGVILGVTQAALGLRIMLVALSDIGVFSIRV